MIYKRVKFAFSLAKRRLFPGGIRPYFVSFNITDRCNLKCTYCASQYFARGTPDPSLGEILRTIDELKNLGVLRITLVGGEPLIRDDIDAIVSYIRQNGLECSLVTNGFLVPKKIGVVEKVEALDVSIEGGEEYNDTYRGKGAYRAAIEAIKIAKSRGVKVFTTSIVYKQKVEDIDLLIDIARKHDILASFGPIKIPYDVKNQKILQLDKDWFSSDEYGKVVDRILKYKKENAPIFFSKNTYTKSFNRKEYDMEKQAGSKDRCWGGRFFICIDTNYDIYPCTALVGKISNPSNARKVGLKKAIEECYKNRQCNSCNQACYINFNHIFNFDFGTIIDQLKYMQKY